MKKFLSLFTILLTIALLLPTVSVIAAESAPSSAEEKGIIYSLDFSALSFLPEGIEYGYRGEGASFGYIAKDPSLSVSLDAL